MAVYSDSFQPIPYVFQRSKCPKEHCCVFLFVRPFRIKETSYNSFFNFEQINNNVPHDIALHAYQDRFHISTSLGPFLK